MTRADIQHVIADSLHRIAPELDAAHVDPTADLRRDLDLDSIDFLELVTALHRELGVDIPERDYGQLATLAAAVDYLERRLAQA